jgi:hypothetical protein
MTARRPIGQRQMLTAAQTLDAVPGLTYRMLDHWIGCGYLSGVTAPHTGKGFPREIPHAELDRLRIMVDLTTRFGVRASVAANLVDALLDIGSIRSGRIRLTLESDDTP